MSRPIALTKDMAQVPLLLECTSIFGTDGSLSEQFELKDPLIKGLNVSATGKLTNAG